jgi:hypothetical protein
LKETLLDLEKLAVAIELTLDVCFVERVTGFGLLQLLDHRRVLLVGCGGAPAAPCGEAVPAGSSIERSTSASPFCSSASNFANCFLFIAVSRNRLE